MVSMYLIKPNGNLGFSRVESSNTADTKREEYEAEGYRSVNELEYTIAGLLNVHGVTGLIRIVTRLGEEKGKVK